MAITDIQISDELQAGAPSIKYRGNEGPQSPLQMAMADPMLIEEYKKYVYSMQEQGQEPVSFEQFVQEIMSGMADGGRAGYGFGSFVKKITKPIKSIVKSPVGKTALAGAALYGLNQSGLGPLGKVGLGLGALSALPLLGIGMGEEETLEMDMPDSQKFDMNYSQMRQDIGDAVSSGVEENFHEVLDKYNLKEGVNINFWEDIRKPSAQGGRIGYDNGGTMMASAPSPGDELNQMSLMIFKKPLSELTDDEYEDLQEYIREKSAQGGRIGAQEGGIMDLGGMEKDYRNTGGFVDLGAEEKADDVPARLSVNEFVMTADAVRGAGDGDIDKGAEVMEDMMSTLEEKGRMTRGGMMPRMNFPSNMKSRMYPMGDAMDSGIAEVLKGTIESIGPSFHGGQQLQELETISDGGGMLNIKRQDPGGIPNIKRQRIQGGPQYLQRMQHLMSLGYSYAEAARIAADSNRYYNIVGSGARRGASDMFEVSERLSEVV